MKSPYSTIILRYAHDVVTGEFVNVGIVICAPEQRFLKARFTTDCARLNGMFLKIDEQHYRETILHLANQFEKLAGEIRDGLRSATNVLPGMVKEVLPPDDSSLQWSGPSGGFTANPANTLDELYKRFVERYNTPPQKVAEPK